MEELNRLHEMLQSLYCAANEMGPGSSAYDFLCRQIDTVNGQIAEHLNTQSYQAGEIAMESDRSWRKAA